MPLSWKNCNSGSYRNPTISDRVGKGFTLIEILVALAVLAVVSTTVMHQMSNSSAQISTFEKRTFARMLAQNKIAEIRLGLASSEDPALSAEFAGMRWRTEVDKSDLQGSNLIRLEVRVYEDNRNDTPYYRLAGYGSR